MDALDAENIPNDTLNPTHTLVYENLPLYGLHSVFHVYGKTEWQLPMKLILVRLWPIIGRFGRPLSKLLPNDTLNPTHTLVYENLPLNGLHSVFHFYGKTEWQLPMKLFLVRL